jgi:hypothetical protein
VKGKRCVFSTLKSQQKMKNSFFIWLVVQPVHIEIGKRLFSIMFVKHSGIWGNSWEVVL